MEKQTCVLYSTTLTIDKCKEHCLLSNYDFAGVKSSTQCFCGDIAPRRKLPDSECKESCSGNEQQICGGRRAMNVFSTKGEGKNTWQYM